MPTYVMQTRGGTEGAETGEYRQYAPGDEIEAPEGEFRHLSPGSYQTRPATPSSSTKTEEKPDNGIHHVGNGWYEVRVGGMTAAKERGKEKAESTFQELTEEE